MRTPLVLALVALTGCTGSVNSTGSGDDDDDSGDDDGGIDTAEARALFDDNVYPVLEAKCVSCHNAAGPSGNVTGFVNADPNEAYDTITGFTALVGNYAASAAGVLGKIEAGHQGIVYTQVEIDAITEWLDMEVELRGDKGGDDGLPDSDESPSAATARLLAEWSGCMSIDNFTASNMPTAWGKLNTQNNQQCENCHVSGAEGFVATQQPDPFFAMITEDKYYMLQYFTVDLSGGAANAKVMINQASFLGVSQGQDPHRQHPRFDAVNNAGMVALQNFYTLTEQRKADGACEASRLIN